MTELSQRLIRLERKLFGKARDPFEIATADLADEAVTTAKLGPDSVTGAKIGDDQVDSEHYVAGSIDNEHLADSAVDTAEIADGAVTFDKLDATAWTGVTFENSWANTAGQQNCQYRRVGDMVHLRGYIDSGTNNTVAFTLPAGFRPPANFDVPTASWTGAAHVVGNMYVQTTGAVIVDRTTGTAASFSVQFSVTA